MLNSLFNQEKCKREGDRIKDGLQIEMTEREKDGGKKKEKGEKGAGEEQGRGRKRKKNKKEKGGGRRKETKKNKMRGEGKKEGIKRDRGKKKKEKLLIYDSGQASSSYPRRKYIMSWVAIVGHCFVLY